MRHIVLCLLVLLAFCGKAAASSDPSRDCRAGTQQLLDRRILGIGQASASLRWRLADGATDALQGGEPMFASATGRPDGCAVRFYRCPSHVPAFARHSTKPIPFIEIETRLLGAGVTLVVCLMLAPGDAVVPVLVLVNGSETGSALQYANWQRLLAASGIGAFVLRQARYGAL